jgi:hypothetical protein
VKNIPTRPKNRMPGWKCVVMYEGSDTLEVDKINEIGKYNRNLNLCTIIIHLHCILKGKKTRNNELVSLFESQD